MRHLWVHIIAACVGGAAAPMAFFDLLFLWVMLSGTLLYLSQTREASGHGIISLVEAVGPKLLNRASIPGGC